MSWRDSSDTGEGHSAIWIHPTQNLYFRFMGSKSPAINQEWIDALMTSANSARGLLVMREGSDPTAPTQLDVAAGTVRPKPRVAPRVKPASASAAAAAATVKPIE